MNKNILIVDDEELILENLEILLEDLSDNIFKAENGEIALKVLEENEINLVISDINMPIMGGIDFIKNVRERGNEVPFIFFTAHGNQELMLETIQYGAFDFINKPGFRDLEEIVQRGFEHSFKTENLERDSKKDVISDYKKMLGVSS